MYSAANIQSIGPVHRPQQQTHSPNPHTEPPPVLTNAKHRPDRMAGAALTQSQGL